MIHCSASSLSSSLQHLDVALTGSWWTAGRNYSQFSSSMGLQFQYAKSGCI